MKVSKAAPSSCTLMLGLGLLALLPLFRDALADLVLVAIFFVLLGFYSFFPQFPQEVSSENVPLASWCLGAR